MKGTIALVLLVAGVCLAATAGSQLGDEQASRTPISAQQEVAGGIVDKVAGCADTLEKTELRIARERETDELTDKEATEAREAAMAAQVRCRASAIATWRDSAPDDLTEAQLAAAYAEAEALADEATATLDAEPRLEPMTRVREWFSLGGVLWLVGLVLIVAGAVLGRRAAYERATAPSTTGTAAPPFDEAIATLRTQIAAARALVAPLRDGDDSVEARAIIEALETDVLAPVVDERDRYKARDGIVAFAGYFGPFSAAERNLARAWSSLTDGYPHVALEALDTAEAALGQAEEAYRRAVS